MTVQAREAADPGLFGPDSVTWKLHANPAMFLAGVTSLYLQALHPDAVRGVVQNSSYREDPLGRLRRTAAFVGVTTYGTRAEAEAAGERVRRVHDALRWREPGSGNLRRVDEPDLLRWVHCAEVGSFLHLSRRAGLRLSDADADCYLDEQRRVAELVGLDPDSVPGSVAALRSYLASVRPQLERTPEALDVYDFLMAPPVPLPLALPRTLMWQPVSLLAFSALPGWARELYRKPALPGPAVTPALRSVVTAWGLVPGAVRYRFPSGPILPRALQRLGLRL